MQINLNIASEDFCKMYKEDSGSILLSFVCILHFYQNH